MRIIIFTNFLFIFFVSFFYLIKSSEFISLQLNYYYKPEAPLSSYLYTKIKLGEPNSTIYAYISSKNPLFSMFEVLKKLDESELSTYYNISSSQSFKNISCLGMKFVSSDKDIQAQENFRFNLYNNKTKEYREIEIKDFNFVLGVKTFKLSGYIYYMNIGFPIIRSGSERDYFYFILQLKEKNITENFDWFIYFEDNKKLKESEIFNMKDLSNINPILIIGEKPHYFKNDLFYKSQLLSTYTEVYAWTLKFKEVYIAFNETLKIRLDEKLVEIYLDDLKIYAPNYYMNIVKREFFKKYPDCHEYKDEEKIYYCDKTDTFTIDNLKSFPTLYFDHYDFEYVFELTYKDLFVEHEGKFIFLVVENRNDDWLIGYSFLKKYQFVFNEDSRSIGFYNPNLPKEKEIDDEDDQNKNETIIDDDDINNEIDNGKISTTTLILIIVLCGIFFIAIGLILGKIIFKNKRKKANELEDNYDYNPYGNKNEENIN